MDTFEKMEIPEWLRQILEKQMGKDINR